MSHGQTNHSANSHPRSQHPNTRAQQDSGAYGPNTFRAAGAHIGLRPGEVDALGRVSPSTQWQIQSPTTIPPIPANGTVRRTSAHPSGHSQQYHPQMPYQGTYGQGTHPGSYQHPAPHFHPHPLQSQPHNVPHAPQQGGSHPPQASAEDIFAWNQLRHNRARWNPNALEPSRDGQSVLMNFTLRAGGTIKCRVPTSNGFCDYSNSKKGRLLHHIRKDHLDFLPFACGGECSSPHCELRFACEASRDDHLNPRKAECPFCKKEFCSQNVAKHRETCRMRPSIYG